MKKNFKLHLISKEYPFKFAQVASKKVNEQSQDLARESQHGRHHFRAQPGKPSAQHGPEPTRGEARSFRERPGDATASIPAPEDCASKIELNDNINLEEPEKGASQWSSPQWQEDCSE